MQFRNFLTMMMLLWNRYGDGDITRLHQDVVLTSVSVISSLDTEGTWRREKGKTTNSSCTPKGSPSRQPRMFNFILFIQAHFFFLFCFGYNKHEFLKSCDHHCL